MSLLPKIPSTAAVLRSINATSIRPSGTVLASHSRRFASGDQTQKQESKNQDGSKPQPKIYSASPPREEDQSEDVARHNREMEQRHDRPIENVKDADVEKDKVRKGFWSGKILVLPCLTPWGRSMALQTQILTDDRRLGWCEWE